jgi:hypothetical protein
MDQVKLFKNYVLKKHINEYHFEEYFKNNFPENFVLLVNTTFQNDIYIAIILGLLILFLVKNIGINRIINILNFLAFNVVILSMSAFFVLSIYYLYIKPE